MAKRIACVRRRNTLVPCDDVGREIFNGISPNRLVLVEVFQNRSPEQHRLYWALIDLVWKNLPEKFDGAFPTKECLSDQIKIECGHYDRTISISTGEVYLKARSIAWDKMQQADFGVYFRAAVEVITKMIIVDLDVQHLLRQLDEMLG